MFLEICTCNFLLKCCIAALYAIFCMLQSARFCLIVNYCKFTTNVCFLQVIDFYEKERIRRGYFHFLYNPFAYAHGGLYEKWGFSSPYPLHN